MIEPMICGTYANLIRDTIRSAEPFVPAVEDDRTIQVERGITLPIAMRGGHSANSLASAFDRLAVWSHPQHPTRVVDAHGHQRPVYHPLLICMALHTYRLLPDFEQARWHETLRACCVPFYELIVRSAGWSGILPASQGSAIAVQCWGALVLQLGAMTFGCSDWAEQASRTFSGLVQGQCGAGPFLTTTSSDNPETHWYHELLILHAAADYAVQSSDDAVLAAAGRNAQFHLAETQPDHATTHPWALRAFLLDPSTYSIVEHLLHTARTYPTPLTHILLADCLLHGVA